MMVTGKKFSGGWRKKKFSHRIRKLGFSESWQGGELRLGLRRGNPKVIFNNVEENEHNLEAAGSGAGAGPSWCLPGPERERESSSFTCRFFSWKNQTPLPLTCSRPEAILIYEEEPK